MKSKAEVGAIVKPQAEGGAIVKPTPKAQGAWALSAEGRGIVGAKAVAVIFLVSLYKNLEIFNSERIFLIRNLIYLNICITKEIK